MRSDEELMEAYVRGDRRAFDEIHRRYQPVLAGVMRKYLSSSHDVEDVVQLTFLNLHRARASYRLGTPLRPWLFMIARNARRDLLRGLRRRGDQSGSLESVATTDDPSDKLEQAERAGELYGALRKLSAILRRTVELHWLDDLAFEEVARIERIPPGTARVRAHRGCMQLRAWMAAGSRTHGALVSLPSRSRRAVSDVA
jgi:RNA polymerase sigma-70 factor, ECF subfamily